MKWSLSRNLIVYLLIMFFFGSLLVFIINAGAGLEIEKKSLFSSPEPPIVETPNIKITKPEIKKEKPAIKIENPVSDYILIKSHLIEFSANFNHPLSRLILQIIVIAFFARLFAFLSGKIGQPRVVGEIIAGIAIGPSLLGMVFPSFYGFLFPAISLPILQMLSQIGLIIFMFLIGMELDLKVIRKKAHEAVLISHSSIMVPFVLGVIVSYYLYVELSPRGVPFMAFALFMGIAMSITAFPVLARIIQERGLTRSPMGAMALTCAAADDVTAWIILASVIAIIKAGNAAGALITLVLVIAYIVGMIYLVQPFLRRMAGIYASRENLHKRAVAIIFIFIFASAYSTEVIGIHALFGGFLAGVVMPSGYNFKELLQEKLEDFILIILLPLFFAFTGLRTQIGLLNSPHLWCIFFLILAVAVSGKILGSFLPARFVGINLRDSISIGILMNTRGLMELIVLNIGFELGILSPEIFSMMVLMALSTTFMTGPLLGLVEYISPLRRKEAAMIAVSELPMKILVAFGIPGRGPGLLSVAHALRATGKKKTLFTAMHLTPNADISKREAIVYEKQSFNPVLSVAKKLEMELETIYKVTENIAREILNFGIKRNYHFVLMGAARSLFSDNILGGKIKSIMDSKLNVGIYIEKKNKSFGKVLVLTAGDDNAHAKSNSTAFRDAALYQGFIGSGNTEAETEPEIIAFADNNRLISAAERLHLNLGSKITVCELKKLDQIGNPEDFDLILISAGNWKTNSKGASCWLPPVNPSMLILKMNENCFDN